MTQDIENDRTTASATQIDDPFAGRVFRALLFTPLQMFVHFIALCVFCLIATRLVQQYHYIFEEKDVVLPAITIRILEFSNKMTALWYLLFVALILVDGPLLFGLQLLPRKYRWLNALFFNLVVLAVLLAIGWIVVTITHSYQDTIG